MSDFLFICPFQKKKSLRLTRRKSCTRIKTYASSPRDLETSPGANGDTPTTSSKEIMCRIFFLTCDRLDRSCSFNSGREKTQSFDGWTEIDSPRCCLTSMTRRFYCGASASQCCGKRCRFVRCRQRAHALGTVQFSWGFQGTGPVVVRGPTGGIALFFLLIACVWQVWTMWISRSGSHRSSGD